MNFESGDLAICETCGTQYHVPLSSHPPSCRICDVRNSKPPDSLYTQLKSNAGPSPIRPCGRPNVDVPQRIPSHPKERFRDRRARQSHSLHNHQAPYTRRTARQPRILDHDAQTTRHWRAGCTAANRTWQRALGSDCIHRSVHSGLYQE